MSGQLSGQATVAVMWVLWAIVIVFVFVRTYTRVFIIHGFGADDVVYIISGIFMLFFTAFLQVSADIGFGKSIPELIVEHGELEALGVIADAIFYEMIGQTFAVLGMSIAKLSLGLFLLRWVVIKWQRWAVWAVMASLAIVSILTAIMFWLQCTPVEGIWDPVVKQEPGTKCNVNITPYAVSLGVVCAIADFFFAGFPALVIWPLNMKKKEKIILISSLSLGIFAGIAGVIRTYEVAVGFTENYLKDTVPLVVWSAVEVAVTMICIGIPVLRPLWRKVTGHYGSSNKAPYEYHGEGNSQQYELSGGRSTKKSELSNGSKLGIRTQTITDIQTGNESDEYILGKDHGTAELGLKKPQANIFVKDDVQVEWDRK